MQQLPQQLLWIRLMPLNMHNMMSHMALPATVAIALKHKQSKWIYMRLQWTGLMLAALGGVTHR